MSKKSNWAELNGGYLPIERPDRIKDISGETFGFWSVKKPLGLRPEKYHNVLIFECQCVCGKIKPVLASSLKAGTSTNCGCKNTEKLVQKVKRHGLSRSAEFFIWAGMKNRCENPKYSGFHRYGGRGITVCERWQRFENFYADMGPRPSPFHSVGRLMNDEGYNPKNCEWQTKAEQSKNTSRNKYVEATGKLMCLADWSRTTGVHISTICNRLKRGWSPEKAVLTKTKLQCLKDL